MTASVLRGNPKAVPTPTKDNLIEVVASLVEQFNLREGRTNNKGLRFVTAAELEAIRLVVAGPGSDPVSLGDALQPVSQYVAPPPFLTDESSGDGPEDGAMFQQEIPMGSAVQSVQYHAFAAAGAFTINAVGSKAWVYSVSKGSAGTVMTNSSITLSPQGGTSVTTGGGGGPASGSSPDYSGAMTGGTTNLTVALYSAVLTNPTTITADGPCQAWVLDFT